MLAYVIFPVGPKLSSLITVKLFHVQLERDQLSPVPSTTSPINAMSSYLQGDTSSSCRLPKDCDSSWVSTECSNIPFHPTNGHVLIP